MSPISQCEKQVFVSKGSIWSLKATGALYWTHAFGFQTMSFFEMTHSRFQSSSSVQVWLLHRLTVAGSRWCGNWESLSLLLYGYSILCCTQRSKCIDSYKISTSQCGGCFARSCSKHSAVRKGKGNQYVPFRRDEKSSTNCDKQETEFWA